MPYIGKSRNEVAEYLDSLDAVFLFFFFFLATAQLTRSDRSFDRRSRLLIKWNEKLLTGKADIRRTLVRRRALIL